MKAERAQLDDMTIILAKEYKKLYHAPIKLNRDLQKRIYDSLRGIVGSEREEHLIDDVLSFISDDEIQLALKDAINKRHNYSLLYSQPIILLLFYFAFKFPKKLLKNWPYLEEQLEPIFADLGATMPSLIS